MRQLIHSTFSGNYLAAFHLWWTKTIQKHKKISQDIMWGYSFKLKLHRKHHQILLLVRSEFKQINELLFLLKLFKKKIWFSDDFRESSSQVICLNSLNMKNKIWWPSLTNISHKIGNFSSAFFFTKNLVIKWASNGNKLTKCYIFLLLILIQQTELNLEKLG